MAGTLGLAATAPKMLSLVKHIDPKWQSKLVPERRIALVYASLRKRGLIANIPGSKSVVLTQKGRQFASRERLKIRTRDRKPRWDGRWRVLIFDLPEKERRTRDRLRLELQEVGFIQLQRSVWVYPYQCDDYILLLKKEVGAGRRALYMIVESLEGDAPLKKYFKL